MEEAAHLGSEPQKSTFEVRGPAAALHAISHPHIVATGHDPHPPCIAFLFLADPLCVQ